MEGSFDPDRNVALGSAPGDLAKIGSFQQELGIESVVF